LDTKEALVKKAGSANLAATDFSGTEGKSQIDSKLLATSTMEQEAKEQYDVDKKQALDEGYDENQAV